MVSLWRRWADRRGVAPRTADWRQEIVTINWPSERCAKPLLEWIMYTSRDAYVERDNVVHCKEPSERSIMISYASRSVKKISERMSIKVCGVVSPYVSELWIQCVVYNKLLGDRAFDDLGVCVRCGICSESECLSLWLTELAIEWIVLMGEQWQQACWFRRLVLLVEIQLWSGGVKCVRVPLVEDKNQEGRKSVYLYMSLSELCQDCYAASP